MNRTSKEKQATAFKKAPEVTAPTCRLLANWQSKLKIIQKWDWGEGTVSGIIEFRHYNYGSQHAVAGVCAIRHGTVEVKESHHKQLAECWAELLSTFNYIFLQFTFLFTNVVERPPLLLQKKKKGKKILVLK